MTPLVDPNQLEATIKELIEACGGCAPEYIKWHAAHDVSKDGLMWLVEYKNHECNGHKRVIYND